MQILYAPAEKKDVEKIRAFAIRSFSDAFAADNKPEDMVLFFKQSYELKHFQEEFDEPYSYLYVAKYNDEVIGFVRLRHNMEVNYLISGLHIELHRLYVDKAFHGKRVAATLMEWAINKAIEEDKQWMWLGVWEKNFRAQAFYQKYGFVRFGEHPFLLGKDLQTDWLFKKKLPRRIRK